MRKSLPGPDSHVITDFGEQHRANKSYNPKKRGRKSYHPMLCLIGETRDYQGGILRPDNSTDVNQARSFLTLMLRKLPFGMVARLRADSGFPHMDFRDYTKASLILTQFLCSSFAHYLDSEQLFCLSSLSKGDRYNRAIKEWYFCVGVPKTETGEVSSLANQALTVGLKMSNRRVSLWSFM